MRIEGGTTPRALTFEQRLAVQYSIARAFAEAEQLDEVAELVLRALADAFGWSAGGLWVPATEADHLVCAATYASTPDLEEWTRQTRALKLGPGSGLPGRIWVTGEPAWIRDTDLDENFPRRDAARVSGLRHGYAFPVSVGGTIGAVVELFAADVRDVDLDQTEFLNAVAHQLGSFMERTVARRAVAVSEARKAAVLAAAVDAIVSSDAVGRIVEFNAAAELLFGWSRDEAVGRTIAEVMVPEDIRQAHIDAFLAYRETGVPHILGQRVRTWGLHRDGSRIPVELTVTETRSAGDAMFTAFVRDITHERQAETARERFMEILSHELRTPVTAIYGGAKVLARSSLAESQRQELIADIGHEADRLHRLVENLIVLARAERGDQSVAFEPVHVLRVTERVVAELAGTAPPIEVRDHSRAAVVHGDQTYVEQLLRNLLSNAVKYGAGQPIQVDIRRLDGHAVVRVSDRGRGIDPAEASRLFEIDYRSPLTTSLAQGSGIGLFVAGWLTETMKGRIWASPRPGGGSEFAFALPLVDSGPA